MIKFVLLTLALLACSVSADRCRGLTSSLVIFKCTGSFTPWSVLGMGGHSVKHYPNTGEVDTFADERNPEDLGLLGYPSIAPQIDGACGSANCNNALQFLQQVIMSPDYITQCPPNLLPGGADHNKLCAGALTATRITGTNAAQQILGFKFESVYWNAAIPVSPQGFFAGQYVMVDGAKSATFHGGMTTPYYFEPRTHDKKSLSTVPQGMGRNFATQNGLQSQQASAGRREVVDVVDVEERRGDSEEGCGGECICGYGKFVVDLGQTIFDSLIDCVFNFFGGGMQQVPHKRGLDVKMGAFEQYTCSSSAPLSDDASGRG